MASFSRDRFNTESNDDLVQGMDLDVEIAQDARQNGDRQREADAHRDLNDRLDEGRRRGLFR